MSQAITQPLPQTGIADIINRVSQQHINLTPQAKRSLTNVRNRLNLPSLDGATEVCAAVTDVLSDFVDTNGCIEIIHPISRVVTRIKLS